MQIVTRINQYIEYIEADRIHIKNKHKSRNTYLVFSYNRKYFGIATRLLTVLGFIYYAEKKKMKIVIDMNREIDQGISNVWDLYFKQPMYEKDVDSSSIKYIYDNCSYAIAPFPTRFNYCNSTNDFSKFRKIVKPTIIFPSSRDFINNKSKEALFEELYNRYIRFNEQTKIYLDNEYEKILKNKSNVLGVLIRGTDYVQRKPKKHPIQPTACEVIEKIKELKTKEKWEYIYLATEEKKNEDLFNRSFPGKVLINKRMYYDGDYSNKWLCDSKHNRKNDEYLKDLEYLSSMNLLSKCDMFIGGMCGGTQTVLIMNGGKFSYVYLFDLGDYS